MLNSKLCDDVYLNASPTDRVKRNYYIVVPNGQGIYDILGTALLLDSAFATQVGSFTNHKIYKSTSTSISITSIIIR